MTSNGNSLNKPLVDIRNEANWARHKTDNAQFELKFVARVNSNVLAVWT